MSETDEYRPPSFDALGRMRADPHTELHRDKALDRRVPAAAAHGGGRCTLVEVGREIRIAVVFEDAMNLRLGDAGPR